ncbi:hypothetical protein ACOZ38_04175 [Sphaerisporangium viridialbum]|uniref:hypothetical protein n=1 Tax=Sphaerisporangium viridialbum TaxID=46189 RepID=UPI003C72CE4B
MLYETAARAGEVLGLDIEDLDRRNRHATANWRLEPDTDGRIRVASTRLPPLTPDPARDLASTEV